MIFNELNDDNYLIFAIKHYDNPQAVTYEDFLNDMKKFKYVKRLLKRYKKTGDLKSHLLINHFIVLYNVFHYKACTRMLCFKLYDYLHYLKPFLVQLSYWPDKIESVGINKDTIIGSDIDMDQKIVDTLRKI